MDSQAPGILGAMRLPVSSSLAWLFSVLLLVGLVSCSGQEPEGTGAIRLAQGGIPSGWISAMPGASTLDAPEGWMRIAETIEPDAWAETGLPGVFRAYVQVPGIGSPPDREDAHELLSGDQQLRSLGTSMEGVSPEGLRDGDYLVMGDEVLLTDRGGAFVSGELTYVAWHRRSLLDSGKAQLPGVTSEGVLLGSGEVLTVDLPGFGSEGATLHLAAGAFGNESPGEPSTMSLEVEHAGQIVFQVDYPKHTFCLPMPVHLDLPDFRGGELLFRVQGDPGILMLQNPVLTRLGSEREDERPDLVVFLADTFRADNLAYWGGDPRLTPHMNDFGKGGRVYTGAHAPGSWTIPSQAALLSGSYAPQVGIDGETFSLPKNLDTLARRLSESGYRTVAVTDGHFVSEHFGFDQGFEVFLESVQHGEFDQKTLKRVQSVLDADDDRPLFLFVQSYRAHTPYWVSDQSMAEHPELFGADPDPADWNFAELFERVGFGLDTRDIRTLRAEGTAEQFVEDVDNLKRMYQGASADLDRGFGSFMEQIEAAGLGNAFVVLTSDHGEAFGEHGGWVHGTNVHEEQVGIPLILQGPGIAHELRGGPVSLVDVTFTLAELAGVGPGKHWAGRSLLVPASDGAAIFSFESPSSDKPNNVSEYAIYQGQRKVIGPMDGQVVLVEPAQAFELGLDPDEEKGIPAKGSWGEQLIERFATELDRATKAFAKADPKPISQDDLQKFKAMGYFGD